MTGKTRMVLRYTEEALPEDPSDLLTDSLKAVTFFPTMPDALFMELLGMLSHYMNGVSLWGTKMIIPADSPPGAGNEKPPPKGEMN